jgi:hypothetical protein
MSRSGVFYVVKAMERAAAGTTTASTPRVPLRRADDHGAPDAIRVHGGRPSRWQRISAVVRGSTGAPLGKPGWGRRRLGRAAGAD